MEEEAGGMLLSEGFGRWKVEGGRRCGSERECVRELLEEKESKSRSESEGLLYSSVGRHVTAKC